MGRTYSTDQIQECSLETQQQLDMDSRAVPSPAEPESGWNQMFGCAKPFGYGI